jgi:hypothetical protein
VLHAALEVINEAEALPGRIGHRNALSEMHRLRGMFLVALGVDENQIEASFCEAVRIARGQKSISNGDTRTSNLCRIPPPQCERVRRTRIPTNSLVTFCSFLSFVQRPASAAPTLPLVVA